MNLSPSSSLKLSLISFLRLKTSSKTLAEKKWTPGKKSWEKDGSDCEREENKN